MPGPEDGNPSRREDPAAFHDRELATRHLRLRLSAVRDEIEAAEPGTDDFLRAYQESSRLERLYREVRGADAVPPEVWPALDDEAGKDDGRL